MGRVLFEGRAPARAPQERRRDPFCAKRPARDESVLVNPNGTLRNVIVRLRDAPPGARFEPLVMPQVIDQVECAYRPRVSGVMVGQEVVVRNSDDTMHDVHVERGGRTLFSYVMHPVAVGGDRRKTFAEGEPPIVRFSCDIHPWMTAWLLVLPHPWFDIAGVDGTFALDGLPAGRRVLEAWHERYGTKTVEVDVPPGGRATVEFVYGAGGP